MATWSFSAVAAEPEFAATLSGFARLPAHATHQLPADLPAAFRISGKFTLSPATARLHSVEGLSKGRPTNAFLPTIGQPVQGFSDLQWIGMSRAWALTDNGFGAKSNSADALLSLTRVRFDFGRNVAIAEQAIFLRDPDRRWPNPLANEHDNPDRYLSGADFDPESFRMVGDSIWIGDEFGPYLLETDLQGRLRQVVGTQIAGQEVCSPDNPSYERCPIQIKRSRGFENLALSADGQHLFAMLEGPLREGESSLTILRFDLRTRQWDRKLWSYPLIRPGNSVGAMTHLRGNDFLVIERDDLEGTVAHPCRTDADKKHCFSEPAQFKRLVRIRLHDDGSVTRLGSVDLLKIRNPQRLGGFAETYAMPFWTIEAVTRVGQSRVLIANDNNFPFSASRKPNQQDDNEFALIDVGALLR